MLVLGAGLQGSACAIDLIAQTDASVTLADARPPGTLPAMLAEQVGKRLAVEELDVRQEATVRELIARHDAVLCALPYYFNFPMMQIAVDVGRHFADLGGNTEIVRQQQTLDEAACRKGIAVTPDVGLAPGMVNILAAEGIRRLARPRTVRLFVGGLPRHPEPPLNYQVVYSLEGALDYYTTPSWVLRDGRPTRVDALSELETVTFAEPIGALEAFHTGGGISTMPWEYAGRVETMEYKTLRYPGHASIMRGIRDLGLLGLEPVQVKGTAVRPRDLFIAVVDPKLRKPGAEDLVALKVVVEGEDGDGDEANVTFQLVDYYDPTYRISAMMRATGYSLSITGQMQVDGRLGVHGVKPAYQTTPFSDYVAELRRRGIEITED
jgi:lysine 6-dehydrogenase